MCHRTRAKAKARNSASSVSVSKTERRKKTRTKTRKPKYISLKSVQTTTPHQQKKHLINFFPLHPQHGGEEEAINVVHVAASFLFDDASTTTTLNSLLSPESEPGPVSNSVGDYTHREEERVGSLVRAAMKEWGRDHVSEDQERWVCYSEVVEKKESEEVASCTTGSWCDGGGGKLLSLKLGYEEILNAWSDKQGRSQGWARGGGRPPRRPKKKKIPKFFFFNFFFFGFFMCFRPPRRRSAHPGDDPPTPADDPGSATADKGSLFVEADNNSSQIVPDLHDPAAYNVNIMDGWGNVGNLWQVPEMGVRVKEEGAEMRENWKTDQREASVLRYKEKRNNRLFSKHIRYEVRKLNAEKRPRLKGRFVKRN